MASIAVNLQAIRARIAQAAHRAGRRSGEITLVAVTKTFSAERVAEAYAAGQQAFAENFAQEAVEKITKVADLAGAAPRLPPLERRVARSNLERAATRSDSLVHSAGVASPTGVLLPPLEWHFIGPLQSNKTGLIAPRFQWVHSVEREKIAQRLHAARPADLPPLNVCIQVNVSGEANKSGVAPGEEESLAAVIAGLPRLKFRGLMAIPEPTPDVALRRRRFALLRERQSALAARGYDLDVLSMGMSDDFEDAIAEGATMVRVGSAIFGPRVR